MNQTDKRVKATFTLPIKLVTGLKEVSQQSMVPQSRLVERALQEIIKDMQTRE